MQVPMPWHGRWTCKQWHNDVSQPIWRIPCKQVGLEVEITRRLRTLVYRQAGSSGGTYGPSSQRNNVGLSRTTAKARPCGTHGHRAVCVSWITTLAYHRAESKILVGSRGELSRKWRPPKWIAFCKILHLRENSIAKIFSRWDSVLLIGRVQYINM